MVGQLPWVCEYTGSVTDYLNSDAASTWREDIVPLCQLNYESAAVILTNRAESMYSFNTGDEALLSGRFFTDEEYINGDDVCVISAAYAEQNGLRLGDMIQLDYYDSGFGEYKMCIRDRLWGDRYQVIVATHLDKENHLHNHFVLNTVSFADGIKYHRTRKDYHEMQAVSDALCREYGLSVIEHPQQGRGKQYGEWRAEQMCIRDSSLF